MQRTTSDDQVKAGRDLLAKGDVEHGIFPLLLAATFGRVEGRDVDYARKETYDNGLLGLPEEDLYAIVKAVVDG